MKFQRKLVLSIPPIVVLVIALLSLWNFYEARESVYQHTYRYLELTLKQTIDNELLRRQNLLADSQMDKVDFFVTQYQQEALKALEQRSAKEQGAYLVVDDKGDVLLAGGELLSAKARHSWVEIATAENAGPHGYVVDEVYHHLYSFSVFSPWDWSVFYIMEDADVNASIFEMLVRSLLAVLVGIVGAVISIVWISKRLVIERVLVLKDAASRIANREDVKRIALDSDDELSDLARSMERMSSDLSQYHQTEGELRLKLEQLNLDLTKSNEDLEQLNKNLEASVAARTEALTELNTQLSDEMGELKQHLHEVQRKRFELVGKISEITLTKADVVQANHKLISDINLLKDENLLLHDQIASYVALLEKTNRELAHMN